MNDQQRKRFYELGCISRSLIKLCEIVGKTITIDEFCNQFEKFFVNTTTDYGMLKSSEFPTVIGLLGLPANKFSSKDYIVLNHEFNNNGKRLILIFSGISLNKGKTNEINHCSVLVGINETEFSVWTCSKDGTDGILLLTKKDWIDKRCSGKILF